MPRNHTDIDLEAEYDRLDDKVREHADEYADAEAGSDYQQLAVSKGNRAQRHRGGIAWALDYPDTDESGSGWDTDTVTLGALTKGDVNRKENAVETVDCDPQDAFVALALVDAPFLEHDPHDISQTEYHRTIRAVTGLDPAFVDWADARASKLASAGDTGKSFMELATDAASATSNGESG